MPVLHYTALLEIVLKYVFFTNLYKQNHYRYVINYSICARMFINIMVLFYTFLSACLRDFYAGIRPYFLWSGGGGGQKLPVDHLPPTPPRVQSKKGLTKLPTLAQTQHWSSPLRHPNQTPGLNLTLTQMHLWVNTKSGPNPTVIQPQLWHPSPTLELNPSLN